MVGWLRFFKEEAVVSSLRFEGKTMAIVFKCSNNEKVNRDT